MDFIFREDSLRNGVSVSDRLGESDPVVNTPIITSELTVGELYRLFHAKSRKARPGRRELRAGA